MSLTGSSSAGASGPRLLEAVGGFLLLLLFAYALSWVMAWIGLIVPSARSCRTPSFIVLFR
jgi:hypothetical protein